MPHINIEVTAKELKNLQIACAVSGQSQKEFVLSAIRLQCLKETGQLGEVKGFVVEEDTPITYKSARVKAADTVETLVEVAEAIGLHNPKTCRLYRCTQCVALGKKF
jgi:ferredoxin